MGHGCGSGWREVYRCQLASFGRWCKFDSYPGRPARAIQCLTVQAFAILPLFSPFSAPSPSGFPTKLPDILPLARGHTGPVLDTAWSPFDDNLVVSGSEDGKGELDASEDQVHQLTTCSLHLEDPG